MPILAQTESLNDIYTRKVGGEKYYYQLEYTSGKRVEWHAHVYLNDTLKGTPNGVITDNRLTGAELRQHIITLVECMIETRLGIEE